MSFFKKWKKWLLILLATLIVMAATVVSIGRLLTPLLNQHRPDFEKWATQLLNMPVQIGGIAISWHIYKPVIDLENVIILDKETLKPHFQVNEIRITLGLLKSLMGFKPVPDYLKITGVRLTLQELSPGQIHLIGFGNFTITDNMTGTSAGGNKMADFIFSQPFLALEDIDVHFTSAKGKAYHFTLNDISLENTGQKHFFNADVKLHQKIDTNMTVDLQWQGKTFDPAVVKAKLYLYVEGISLPQWLAEDTWHDLHLKQGLGSAKIWANWEKNQWQKIQSEFQFYELEVVSVKTKKTQTISRFKGNVGWKRDGARQVIAGDDILIDLPEHLWPTTGFSMTLKPVVVNNENKMTLESLRLDYADIGELKTIALDSGLLPDAIATPIKSIAPDGELYKLNLQLVDTDHLENNPFSVELVDLTIAPWEKWPGLQHMDGQVHWDGKQGEIKINTDDMAITVPHLFEGPLKFEECTANIKAEKDANGRWDFHAAPFKVENDHLTATGHVNLSLPVDASPIIDLAADFSVEGSENVSHYLPLNIFDAELKHWLRNAFHEGTITEGKAVVQGNLHDFPFAQHNGKFEISGDLHDVNLSYAPLWPAINHINGKLSFSGPALSVDVTSAETLNVPLESVHADLPSLAKGPLQILTVTGKGVADLSQGERFILKSPLKQTLGKSLENMELSGPMDLNLKLTLPLAHLKSTTVNGDVIVKNGNIDFPKWKLNAADVNGTFHFTERSLSGPPVHALFFAEPVSVTIQTEETSPTNSIITMKMAGAVTADHLQQWLQLPVLNYVQGKTNYNAELQLMLGEGNTAPNQILIQSNLQGMAVTLPSVYGKKTNEPRDFKLILSFKQDGPLQFKSNYANLFTTAMTLQGSSSGLAVTSGELRIGNQGQAEWQTQPGFVVTGQTDTLNIDEWRDYFSRLEKARLNASASATKTNASTFFLRAVDLKANKIIGFSQTLTNARVQITKLPTTWQAIVLSSEMGGTLIVPNNLNQQPIQAKFEYLYIVPNAKASSQTIDPKTLPAFSFVGEDVRLRDIRLGRVVLDMQPTRTGAAIKQLRVASGGFTFNAQGDWQSSRQGNNQSHLSGTLNTSNLSNFLNQWGIPSPNLIGSGSTTDFDLSWQDVPFAPSLATMSGSLSLALTKGRIINLGESTDAKMGIGRMLNILSLQTIPQLLTLNFKSVFAQGYSFDQMKGDFNLKQGNAFTQNARFDGSVARVEFQGRLGLVKKDSDLLLSVTPYVTGSIPIVAAIAVNPIAGVAAWAVEKVAQSAVSKVTTYKFVVTGPWSNPKWQKK